MISQRVVPTTILFPLTLAFCLSGSLFAQEQATESLPPLSPDSLGSLSSLATQLPELPVLRPASLWADSQHGPVAHGDFRVTEKKLYYRDQVICKHVEEKVELFPIDARYTLLHAPVGSCANPTMILLDRQTGKTRWTNRLHPSGIKVIPAALQGPEQMLLATHDLGFSFASLSRNLTTTFFPFRQDPVEGNGSIDGCGDAQASEPVPATFPAQLLPHHQAIYDALAASKLKPLTPFLSLDTESASSQQGYTLEKRKLSYNGAPIVRQRSAKEESLNQVAKVAAISDEWVHIQTSLHECSEVFFNLKTKKAFVTDVYDTPLYLVPAALAGPDQTALAGYQAGTLYLLSLTQSRTQVLSAFKEGSAQY